MLGRADVDTALRSCQGFDWALEQKDDMAGQDVMIDKEGSLKYARTTIQNGSVFVVQI